MVESEKEHKNAAFLMRIRDRLQRALDEAAFLLAVDPVSARGLGNYRFFTSGTVNKAAEAYVFLRKAGRYDASRMLVRPALEAAYRLNAVRLDETVFFRISYSEFLEEKKWFGSAHRRAGIDKSKETQASLDQFKADYHKHYPSHAMIEQKFSVRDAAVTAQYENHYETVYRLFCTYTHAAFKAATDDLSDFYEQDTHTVSFCVLSALWALVYVNVPIPELGELWDEIRDIQRT